MGLYVEVSYINVDGESDERWHGGEEPLTETVHETPGAVFRAAAGRDRSRPWEAMGRCIGKVYVDQPRGGEHEEDCIESCPFEGSGEKCRILHACRACETITRAVGWVFVSRERYEDTGKPYLREAWVTVHTVPPTITRTPHYADF